MPLFVVNKPINVQRMSWWITTGELPRQKVIIAFGMERFKAGKGVPRPGVSKFYRYLTQQCKDKCTVVDTNERNTSKKCPRCQGYVGGVISSHTPRSLTSKRTEKRIANRKNEPENKEDKHTDDESKEEKKNKTKEDEEECDGSEKKTENKERKRRPNQVYGLLACQRCKVVYDRDNMAAEGIRIAFLEENSSQIRPFYLTRAGSDQVQKRIAQANPWQAIGRDVSHITTIIVDPDNDK